MASSSGRGYGDCIDLEEVEIDSISLNFYLYQDAWIFMPSTVLFIVDGNEYEIANDDCFEKDDNQTVRNLSSGSLEGVKGRNVVVKISNPECVRIGTRRLLSPRGYLLTN